MVGTRGAVLGLLLAAGLLGGCSTRDRSNPLDPGNPNTGGEPQWLTALADEGGVDLSWSVVPYRDLTEVRIVDAEHATVLWSGPGDGTYRDGDLPDGEERRYRLDLVLDSGRTQSLPEVLATPGPAVPWVADAGSGTAGRLTPDGRGRREAFRFAAISTVTVDPASGDVMVLEYYLGRATVLDPAGNTKWQLLSLIRPYAGLYTGDGWWVTDSNSSRVLLLDEEGKVAYTDSTVAFPGDLAPGGPGRVYVVNLQRGVVELEVGRGQIHSAPFTDPQVVATASDGSVWVAEAASGSLVHLDSTLVELGRTPGWSRVEALRGDPVVPGGVWVADRAGKRVVLVDPEGTVVETLGYFPAPLSLAVAPDGSEVWVADPALGQVVRMSREGLELARTLGLAGPLSVDVAFDPGP